MARTFRAPFYPYSPLIALVFAGVAMISMVYYNLEIAGVFAGALLLGFIYFQLTHANRASMPK
jgi:ethanolamine permease